VLGIDNIKYQPQRITPTVAGATPDENDMRPLANIAGATAEENQAFQCILNKEFEPGTFAWLANIIEQNHLNHPIHTSRGLKWTVQTKLAFPTFGDTIGFFKWTSEVHWYTPLINEYDLVFHLHAYAGIAQPFPHKTIPFSEMFNVGGQYSVRGYLFGQISPRFAGDPIGASKAIFWNAELIFPITPDMNMKGVVFYDGGSGFGNPYVRECITNTDLPPSIQNNNFDYRHAVGIGVRMLQPMPIKIDWGFKLDPRKGESASEVHFGMSTAF
jgi:outer membrane protein insertion porin family